MVNIKINTDFAGDREINDKTMAIVTAFDEAGRSETGVYGGEGLKNVDMMTGLVKTVIAAIVTTLQDNPEEIKRHIKAAGEVFTILANEDDWLGGVIYGKCEI